MKTIFTRMKDIRTTDYLEDGVGVADVEKVLDSVGVKLKENETTYRNFSDVLQDLAGKWNTLSDVQKAAIGKVIAGTRQSNVLLTLLQNMSEATRLTSVSLDSAGLAQERYNTYLDSTEAKINQVKVSFEELASSIILSDAVKYTLDAVNNLLKLINSMGGLIPILGSVASVMLMIKGNSIVNTITGMATSFGGLTQPITTVQLALTRALAGIKGFQAGTLSLTTAIKGCTPVIGALGLAITGLIALYNQQKQKHEELMQSYEDEIANNQQTISSVEELKAKYKELSQIKDRTKEQNDELKQVEDNLRKSLNLKKGAIDLVNKSWEENINVIDQAIDKMNEWDLAKQKDVVENAKEGYDKATTNYLRDKDKFQLYDSDQLTIPEKLNSKLSKETEEWVKSLKDEYSDLVQITRNMNGSVNNVWFDKSKMSVEQLSQALKFAQTEAQNYKNLHMSNYYEKMAKSIGEVVEKADNYNEKLGKQAQMQGNLILQNNLQASGVKELADLEEGQLEALQDKLGKQLINTTDEQNAKALKAALEEVDNQLQSLKTSAEENDTATQEATSDVDKLINALNSIDASELDKTTANLIKNVTSSLSSGMDLTLKQIKELKEAFPELADMVNKVINPITYAESVTDEYSDSMKDLNKAIKSVQDGDTLSGEEIVALTRKYPQLTAVVDKSTGAWTLEEKALLSLKNELNKQAKAQIKAELDKTKTLAEQSTKRLKLYASEEKAIRGVTTLQFDENDNVIHSKQLDARLQRDSELADYVKQYEDSRKTLQELQKEYNAIDILGQDENKASKSEKKKDKAKYYEQNLDKIVDVYKREADKIQKETDRIKAEMDLYDAKGDVQSKNKLNEKLDAQLEKIKQSYQKANKDIKVEKDKLVKQLNDMGYKVKSEDINDDWIEEQVQKYEKQIDALDKVDKNDGKLEVTRDKFKEIAEAIKTMNEAMEDNSSNWMSTRKEQIETYIESLQSAIDYQKTLFDETESNRSLGELTLDVEDTDYLDKVTQYNKEEYDEKVKLQEMYWQKYQQLSEKGFTDQARLALIEWNNLEKEKFEISKDTIEKTNEYMQNQIDSLSGFTDKTVDMLKDIDEQKKKALNKEKDALKDKKSALKEEANLRKKDIDARKDELDKIKSEYDYQTKINKLRESLASTISDLNALEFDDTADALVDKVDLLKNLKSQKQELADEEFNHAIDLMKDALEDMKDAIDRDADAREKEIEKQEKLIELQIKAIDDKTDADYKKEAQKKIETDSEGTYNELTKWWTETQGGIKSEIDELYLNAKDALTSLDVSNNGLQESMDKLSSAILENKISMLNMGINTANGDIIGAGNKVMDFGNGTSSNIESAVSDALLKMKDGFSEIAKTIQPVTNTITVPVTLQTKIDGSADEKTFNKFVGYVNNTVVPTISKSIEKLVEGNLHPNMVNISGRTK